MLLSRSFYNFGSHWGLVPPVLYLLVKTFTELCNIFASYLNFRYFLTMIPSTNRMVLTNLALQYDAGLVKIYLIFNKMLQFKWIQTVDKMHNNRKIFNLWIKKKIFTADGEGIYMIRRNLEFLFYWAVLNVCMYVINCYQDNGFFEYMFHYLHLL